MHEQSTSLNLRLVVLIKLPVCGKSRGSYCPSVRSWDSVFFYCSFVRSWDNVFFYCPSVRSWDSALFPLSVRPVFGQAGQCIVSIVRPSGVGTMRCFYCPSVRSWDSVFFYCPSVRSWDSVLYLLSVRPELGQSIFLLSVRPELGQCIVSIVRPSGVGIVDCFYCPSVRSWDSGLFLLSVRPELGQCTYTFFDEKLPTFPWEWGTVHMGHYLYHIPYGSHTALIITLFSFDYKLRTLNSH